MIGCFRLVMFWVSGSCYANMNVEQFQRHIHLITISFNYFVNIWFPRLIKKEPTFFPVQFAFICKFYLFFKNLNNIQYTQYIMYFISSEIYYHRIKKHVEVKKAMGFRTLS